MIHVFSFQSYLASAHLYLEKSLSKFSITCSFIIGLGITTSELLNLFCIFGTLLKDSLCSSHIWVSMWNRRAPMPTQWVVQWTKDTSMCLFYIFVSILFLEACVWVVRNAQWWNVTWWNWIISYLLLNKKLYCQLGAYLYGAIRWKLKHITIYKPWCSAQLIP